MSPKYQKYTSYKYSGLQWIGEIPEHWEIRKIKHYYKIVNGSTPQSTETSFWDGEIIWVTPEDLGKLKSKYIDDSLRKITEDGYNSCGTSLVPEESIILSTRAPIGHIAIASRPLCTNQGCKSLNPIKDVNSSFYFYFLQSFKHILQSLGTGTTFVELGRDELSTFNIPSITLSEQQAIAAFLDRETSRIDKLIEKKERHIELLKEKRQALITRAVTKGLDPDVKMKDSGVEWIGEIPGHWGVKPLRGLFLQRGEFNYGPKTRNILSVVKDVGVINYEDRTSLGNKPSDNIEQYKIIKKGDIVMNRMNIIIGSVGIAREDGAASIEYYVLHPANDHVCNLFYGHLFSSNLFQQALIGIGYGILSHRMRIPFESLKKELLPFPPLHEQERIASFLDKQFLLLNNLVEKLKLQISKLREAREVLISDAVTGKIDVRDYVNLEDISTRKLEAGI